eukprot:g55188.t1
MLLFSLFSLGYVCAAGLLHFIVQKLVAPYYHGIGLDKLAFETASLVQFCLWVPLALGWFVLPDRYLIALPVARELYDILPVWILDRKGYTDHYRHFLLLHHSLSTTSRLVLTILAWHGLSNASFHLYEQMGLGYYCCSIFLVLPQAVEKLLLKDQPPRRLAIASTILFACAHITHASLALAVIYTIFYQTNSWMLIVATAVFAGLNEYASIASGIPLLQKAWSRCVGYRTPCLRNSKKILYWLGDFCMKSLAPEKDHSTSGDLF